MQEGHHHYGQLGIRDILKKLKVVSNFCWPFPSSPRLSFVFYEKPFVIQYFYSGCVVLLGIACNIYAKHRPHTGSSNSGSSRKSSAASNQPSWGEALSSAFTSCYTVIPNYVCPDTTSTYQYINLLIFLNIFIVYLIVTYYNILIQL